MTNFLSITWNSDKGIPLGPITLHYYSLMFMAAFLLGWFLMKKIFDHEGENIEKLDKLFIYSLIGIFLGARLGHVFFYDWAYFKDHPAEILIPFQFEPELTFTGFTGLASHGAAIATIIMVVWYSKKIIHRPVLWVLDRITIPVAIGGAFVRIGNFFNSEILGSETSPALPTAVRFVRGENWLTDEQAMSITRQADANTAYKMIAGNPNFADTLAKIPFRHPAQLYEASGYIIVFAVLYYMYWKTDSRNKPGLLFGVFLILLWSIRFAVEFVKQSQGGFEEQLHVFSTGQWLSIPFILIGFYLIFKAKEQPKIL
ncbi:prolipoprotein diacylglyceryl transferase [Flavobacterium sp. Sd200]|uniref:prolipoprotein diacylglyceryl transferase n=1 Tax=Flavobacterium sp. Sd200 TaxID=2692211 RepID=UPI0013699C6E|nr:prolipoprotein diacylglyceryl transferase [Flavobacterium sp. Sd200]MXN92354.1 prolipoprotein diacylglyceryl transferase [Flavobacterium sp. Sd200]